ncbi:Transcriptional regulatory protein ZraR [bioreactor metagenome]|uniref:Transcriptional regulatory protein ZraR n=1 Tax=bioreactor metagenome TaxID=1076179 RepID=A0A644Z6I8_9ZZZZ
MVAEHRFRADLYYRLNVVTIRIPSLRERREDIPLLTNHLTRVKSAKLSLPERTVSDRTMEYLKSYHWEGNIRQLENVVERAINIMEGEEEIILPRHLPKEITGFERDFRVELLSDTVARAEREAIMSAIEYCKGNKLKAAKLLGISRNALYDRLNRQKDDTKIRK